MLMLTYAMHGSSDAFIVISMYTYAKTCINSSISFSSFSLYFVAIFRWNSIVRTGS